MTEYIDRDAAIAACFDGFADCRDDCAANIRNIPAADVVELPKTGIGDLSDGYHTFNGLYEQRMILFAVLVKAYKDRAWKSYRHEDGEYCFGGGWFIVGIDTPEGNYTYHYENKYWEMFDCKDLPLSPHWDGHTEADAEIRLMSLPDVVERKTGTWIGEGDGYADGNMVYDMWSCGCCGTRFYEWDEKPTWKYCPVCGSYNGDDDDV